MSSAPRPHVATGYSCAAQANASLAHGSPVASGAHSSAVLCVDERMVEQGQLVT